MYVYVYICMYLLNAVQVMKQVFLTSLASSGFEGNFS